MKTGQDTKEKVINSKIVLDTLFKRYHLEKRDLIADKKTSSHQLVKELVSNLTYCQIREYVNLDNNLLTVKRLGSNHSVESHFVIIIDNMVYDIFMGDSPIFLTHYIVMLRELNNSDSIKFNIVPMKKLKETGVSTGTNTGKKEKDKKEDVKLLSDSKMRKMDMVDSNVAMTVFAKKYYTEKKNDLLDNRKTSIDLVLKLTELLTYYRILEYTEEEGNLFTVKKLGVNTKVRSHYVVVIGGNLYDLYAREKAYVSSYYKDKVQKLNEGCNINVQDVTREYLLEHKKELIYTE